MSETPIERIWRHVDEAREQVAKEGAERVTKGEATCPTCDKTHKAESNDGYEFCPECTALCSECHGFGGGGYGMAPHVGLLSPGESQELYGNPNVMHSSKLLPREKWPDNFSEDPECPGLGVYSCPKCGRA